MATTNLHQERVGNERDRRPVVVGVDRSEHGMAALAWAANEAVMRRAPLLVVHVDFYRTGVLQALAPGLLAEERSVLDLAMTEATRLAPGVAVSGRILEPPVADALIEASEGALMLVVGARGLGHLKEWALGSVSNECAHRARCPVLIVRGDSVRPFDEDGAVAGLQPAGAPI